MGVEFWYPQGIERLRKSLLAVNSTADFLYWTAGYPTGCPKHSEVPYGFKPWALEYARKLGYKRAIWLDASFWAINSVEPNFEIIKQTGSLLIRSGNLIGNWTHDKALESFGKTRDEAMQMQMYIAGGFGLSFEHSLSNKFLDKLLAKSQDGFSFQGKWDNMELSESNDIRCRGHRHDMAIGSLIMHELGLQLNTSNKFMAHFGSWESAPQEKRNVSFLLQGM